MPDESSKKKGTAEKGIEEKLNTLLAILPELENYKQRITLLEEENKALQTSLENSQAEIEDLRALVDGVNLKQEAANTSSERIEHEIKELHRRHVKLECHSRRGNLKFFGIKERENETNNDTELALREFMRTKLKILPVDEKNIHFDRVHRITSRHSQSNGRSLKPRPIIVRLTDFQDKFCLLNPSSKISQEVPGLVYPTIFLKKLTR